jgi:hypothetical protein
MVIFNSIELNNEYESYSNERQKHLNELKNIIIKSGDSLEGNSFYTHLSLNINNDLYTKQVNLFWCGKQSITRICEIGFNAGHSTMLMLLGRDKTPLDFTIFDIGEHPYTKPSLEYIRQKFENVNFEYIEGDSIITIPKWIEENKQYIEVYDVVHVDGGHSNECITNDMKNANLLVKENGIIIIDDTNMGHINNCVDLYLASGKYKELEVLQTKCYPHRIIKKISK